MTDRTWIEVKDRVPEVAAEVLYYFDVCGVFRGMYLGESEEHLGAHVFFSESGVLVGDVTHWMPDDGGELPEPPMPPEKALDELAKEAQELDLGYGQGQRRSERPPRVTRDDFDYINKRWHDQFGANG